MPKQSPCGVGRVDRASPSDARGSGFNPAPSENTASLPRSPRGSPRSWAHRRISELSEGGGVKPKKCQNKNKKGTTFLLILDNNAGLRPSECILNYIKVLVCL